MKHKTLRQAFLDSLPVMAGYMVLGFGFGVLLQKDGYPFYVATLMSLTIFAGSLQYAAVSLFAQGAGLITTALVTLMVNARHLFYGLSMLEKYRDTGKAKPYLIASLTDETYSLVSRDTIPDGVDKKKYYVLVSVLDHSYWIIGSTLGALFGTLVQFNSQGVEFAMTALFVVIFVDQWLSTKQHLPAIIGLGASLVCLVIFGAADFLIPSMVAISAALLLLRKRLGKGDAHAE